MGKPLAVDLFCGLGGWTEGLLAEGYEVVGFDIEQHVYGEHRYPAQLVLQDVRTLHGSQFKDASIIVASSPCQKYSYMAMPWTKAKALAKWYRDPLYPQRLDELNELFVQARRIQAEASATAGRHIPMIQENVRGACPWVGRSAWSFGSYHLWGDVPALMPATKPREKVGGIKLSEVGFNVQACRNVKAANEAVKAGKANANPKLMQDWGHKNAGGSWFNVGSPGQQVLNQNPVHRPDRIKQGGDWFNETGPGELRSFGSKSNTRKAASAAIAKIPFTLAQHIARVYFPSRSGAVAK